MVRFVAGTVILALAGIGIGAGIFVWGLGGTPQVAVMNGPQDVIDDELADALRTQLTFVTEDSDIKAVVIRVNSPGGFADRSEEIFTLVSKLREEKPVVIVVQGLAASGAYMFSMGANHIVANPSSAVGSVGALTFIRPRGSPSEGLIGTGPSKVLGSSERTSLERLELVKESFYSIVRSQRGDRLLVDKNQILQAEVYLGLEALQMGLIDELGDEVDAIRKAAELAKLKRYRVVEVDEMMEEAGGGEAAAIALAKEHRPTGDFSFDILDDPRFPYLYYLYLPP